MIADKLHQEWQYFYVLSFLSNCEFLLAFSLNWNTSLAIIQLIRQRNPRAEDSAKLSTTSAVVTNFVI